MKPKLLLILFLVLISISSVYAVSYIAESNGRQMLITIKKAGWTQQTVLIAPEEPAINDNMEFQIFLELPSGYTASDVKKMRVYLKREYDVGQYVTVDFWDFTSIEIMWDDKNVAINHHFQAPDRVGNYLLQHEILDNNDKVIVTEKEEFYLTAFCVDGTEVGDCSTEKPLFCEDVAGLLILSDECQICGCPSGYDCHTSGLCFKHDPCEGVTCNDNDPCTIDECNKLTGICEYEDIKCPVGQVCVGGTCQTVSCTNDEDCKQDNCKVYVCENDVCKLDQNIPEGMCAESIWSGYPDCKWDNSKCYIPYIPFVIGIIVVIGIGIYGFIRLKKKRK